MPDPGDAGSHPDGGPRRLRHVAGGAAAVAVPQVAGMGLSFVVSVVLARWLGASEFGTYSFVLSWVTVLGVVGVFGLDTALVSRIPAYASAAAWGRLRGLLRWANGIALIASLGTATLALLAGSVISGGAWPPAAPWLLAAGLLPLTALLRLQEATLRGLHHAAAGQVPGAVLLPVAMLTLVGIAWSGGRVATTAEHALIALGLAATVALVVALWLVRRAVPRAANHVPASYEHRGWLGTSARMLLLTSLGTLNARVGILVLGAFAAPEVVGQYAVALRGAGLVSLALGVTNLAMGPAIVLAHGSGQHSRMQLLVRQMSRVALIGGLPVAAALVIGGGLFLGLFGPGFETAYPALVILVLGEIANVVAGPVASLLVMTRHERDAMRGLALGTALNAALCLVLIPAWGINGAAVAAGTGLALWNLVLWRSVRSRLGIVSSVVGGDTPAPGSRDG